MLVLDKKLYSFLSRQRRVKNCIKRQENAMTGKINRKSLPMGSMERLCF